jgi:hypothetical protein
LNDKMNKNGGSTTPGGILVRYYGQECPQMSGNMSYGGPLEAVNWESRLSQVVIKLTSAPMADRSD